MKSKTRIPISQDAENSAEEKTTKVSEKLSFETARTNCCNKLPSFVVASG